MATLFYNVTNDPDDIVAALSLTAGTTYAAQYNGPSILKIVEAAAAPNAAGPALEVLSRQQFTLVPATGEQIYVWTTTAGGVVVINEVP